ncbi:hypothetical protein PoB_002573600 [Plakobranchus ocellatus]|uniref:Uncharacterized protein n=1 Tax=Plakobranchus ocellatus TaxID=259542 RepID=A0AAV3ZJE9_9GAST|nr:hypothetical protein PoB_002573600 [Plakobranchus ocellatus]
MVELKSNDQAKKLEPIMTFLGILVTVSPHKSLNSSKGVIRSRDLRFFSEEEMVEELSGVGVKTKFGPTPLSCPLTARSRQVEYVQVPDS